MFFRKGERLFNSMYWKFILFILVLPILGLILAFNIAFVYYTLKGYRIKSSSSRYKADSVLKRIYVDFPRQFWLDRFNRDPDEFDEYGLHLFCGEQGSGKTTAVVHLLQILKKKYPRLKIRTNFSYKYEDEELTDWKQLISNDNGIYGQVEVIDEIQTWFSSLQSKNFPPEMLTEISQQRKQRKMLIGTAQVFGRVAKPIREQTTFVYLPMTLFGCLTIVRVSKPIYYDEENFRFKKYIRTYFFVHNEKIRNAFDTYRKIERYRDEGFYANELFRGTS